MPHFSVSLSVESAIGLMGSAMIMARKGVCETTTGSNEHQHLLAARAAEILTNT